MQYGINIDFFAKTMGMPKAAELIAKAGFTQLDYTPPLKSEHWKEDMKEALAVFNDHGLTVHQTHAPYNRYGAYKENYALCLARCAEATAYMDAKFMVAHGDEFDFENRSFSAEAALEYNHNIFAPYVTQAGKDGYQVAFETVFEDCGRRRYTSDADELLALINSFDSENAVCCWDFGHAFIAFKKNMPEMIRKLGHLIRCTHLHDNNSWSDTHQIPMSGDIDWKATMDAFHQIEYPGIMSIEYAHGHMPEHLLGDYIDLTYRIAAHLWSL